MRRRKKKRKRRVKEEKDNMTSCCIFLSCKRPTQYNRDIDMFPVKAAVIQMFPTNVSE